MDVSTTACPDDAIIAAYFEGRLADGPRNDMHLHVADCTDCRNQLALLSRLSAYHSAERPSRFAVARVHGLIRDRRRRVDPRWAAAAILVLAIGLAWQWRPFTGLADSPADQTRIVQPAGSRIGDLAPTVRPMGGTDELHIVWAPVESALYYDVNLVSRFGDLLLTQRVDSHEITLTVPDTGTDDQAVYVRVDAWLSASRKISSRHVLAPGQELP